jgi:hypothetical protein
LERAYEEEDTCVYEEEDTCVYEEEDTGLGVIGTCFAAFWRLSLGITSEK